MFKYELATCTSLTLNIKKYCYSYLNGLADLWCLRGRCLPILRCKSHPCLTTVCAQKGLVKIHIDFIIRDLKICCNYVCYWRLKRRFVPTIGCLAQAMIDPLTRTIMLQGICIYYLNRFSKSKTNRIRLYSQVQFIASSKVVAVATRGGDAGGWTTLYRLAYSGDCGVFHNLLDVAGNNIVNILL